MLPLSAANHENKTLLPSANSENTANCIKVGFTQENARVEPTSIHKVAIILAAKLSEKRWSDTVFNDVSDKDLDL